MHEIVLAEGLPFGEQMAERVHRAETVSLPALSAI